ncbi:nitronate monooxygenase family protein [Streptomyces sp. FIT100]|uniref:NAD(P)H-dependent flavin oxidoreductase n=1 Tax=Streptomyces sp. FIT100 TaxID=2837956 RepID=UPI0021CA44F5|nr:nitronate monooxygenase [Streptomyces sp. FIT100]UUN25272.1 nitronate monooxygenase [Streptomyces sp. FIT100]
MRLPVIQAPMAGASPPELAVAVAQAGGMGAAGVLLETPDRIAEWADRFRARSSGAFQLNVWIPERAGPDPAWRQRLAEDARTFLGRFGTPGRPAGTEPPVFQEQCEAMLAAGPSVVSSIMGLFEPAYVSRLHEQGIAWFACATTLDEALAAQEAGADAVVAQGMEAGGHRGSFDQEDAERIDVGLFALLPWFADHLRVPIVAAGGIADGRGVAAALSLGASAVQVGTALLRCPEAGTSPEWSAALNGLAPDATMTTRAYTGRLARAAPTPYLKAWTEPGAANPAPFPDQLSLVNEWRQGQASGVDRAAHWAGQSAALAAERPAGQVVADMWREACELLA